MCGDFDCYIVCGGIVYGDVVVEVVVFVYQWWQVGDDLYILCGVNVDVVGVEIVDVIFGDGDDMEGSQCIIEWYIQLCLVFGIQCDIGFLYQ